MIMTEFDFTGMLDEVASGMHLKEGPKPRVVTPKMIMARAKWMAENHGYIPSEASLQAIKFYLEGYALWLAGPVSSGKSMFFKAIGESVYFLNMVQIQAMKLDEIKADLDAMRDRAIVIDDVGAEPLYNNFGQLMELLPWILEQRLWLNVPTHFTTNNTNKQLHDRYKTRTFDRMIELAKRVEFTEGSKRRPRIYAKR